MAWPFRMVNGTFMLSTGKEQFFFETYTGLLAIGSTDKVSSIGSFQKELVYKYCSGSIIGEDGKSHKIWDYLDLN